MASDLAALGARADLDFSGYVYDRTHLHECDYNWKSFIEVYLEDYHVGPYHPGLSNFVSCDNLHWELGRDYSVQTVGVRTRAAKHWAVPARPSTSAGRTPCCAFRRARRPVTARSG